MSKRNLLFIALTLTLFGWRAAAAQFPRPPKIEVPKIGKPKPEQPRTGQPAAGGGQTQTTAEDEGADAQPAQPSGAPPGGKSAGLSQPQASGKPVLLKDTLEIWAFRANFWKSPDQSTHWSWIPQVRFYIFFDNSSTQRYTAEWYNPDGSLWFSEPLRYGIASGTTRVVRIESEKPKEELLLKNAVIATGTYGVRVTNAKTGEVAFQGKFKVNKVPTFPDDPKYKNRFEFYVEEDWLLPVAYVGYEADANWEAPHPYVWVWLKGEHKADGFEARLFRNGQQVASTDENCTNCVRPAQQERGTEGCSLKTDLCQWRQWGFFWRNFVTINTNYDFYKGRVPNTTATNDAPGEYTVKIFYQNQLVRELKFNVNDKGSFHPNAFSDHVHLTDYKILVPAKVSGAAEKWNPAAWKTDMFYGNPVPGFNVP